MIDVIKLPNDLSIDNRIKNKIREVYGTCPYCGEDRRVSSSEEQVTDYDSPKKIGGSGLFKKKYHWYKREFECRECGMVWRSPEYPRLGDDTDANNAIFHAWQNGKNMEINTLLLECFKE